MSVANKKSYQTSRMYYRSKDHKAIYMDGNFHHNIVITDENGNYDFEENNLDKLAWHKQFDDEYIIFPDKILIYPKEKILASPMRRTSATWMQFSSNESLGVKCGNNYFDIYLYGRNTRLTKLTKDGRILYRTMSVEDERLRLYQLNGLLSYDHQRGRLGNHFSCSGGFLTFTRYDDGGHYADIINFQQIDSNGEFGNSIFICDSGDYVDNETVYDVFALDNYIWKFVWSDTLSGWNLYKLSTSGSIVSTYSKIKPYGHTYNRPVAHILNGKIYFTTQHWHRQSEPPREYDIARFLILDEQFNTVFYIDDLPHYTFSETIVLGMTYVKNKYYLYIYWNTNGHPSLKVYSGNNVSSMTLVKTIPYDTRYTFSNLSAGGNSSTLNLTPENYTSYFVDNYHNTYRNRQLVDSDNYVVINGGYVFDNGELDFNENCFYFEASQGGTVILPSQEQIFDKYLDTQGGN